MTTPNDKGLTEGERGYLILIAAGGVVLSFVAQYFPSTEWPDTLEATFWLVSLLVSVWLLYRAVPRGPGGMDFKVGMMVGGAAAMQAYGICRFGVPILMRAIGV